MVAAVAMIVLGLILLRSPLGLLMLAVLIPPTIWLAIAVTLAVVACGMRTGRVEHSDSPSLPKRILNAPHPLSAIGV